MDDNARTWMTMLGHGWNVKAWMAMLRHDGVCLGLLNFWEMLKHSSKQVRTKKRSVRDDTGVTLG